MPVVTPLCITFIRGTEMYKLDKVLKCRSNILDKEFVVPVGTETDFVSMPSRIKFWMSNNDGFIRGAAVIHDYLYSNKSDEAKPEVTREIDDKIVVEGMKDLGVSWIKRQAIYLALRVAGWAAYKRRILP